MKKYVSEAEVAHMAQYARIGLSDSELPKMTDDLNGIIDELQTIKNYDVKDVPPTFHPIGDLSNVERDDVVHPGLTHKEALANAPKTEDGGFVTPSILGGER